MYVYVLCRYVATSCSLVTCTTEEGELVADLRIRLILVLVGVHLLERFSYICLRGSFQYSWDTCSSEVPIILNADMLYKRIITSVTTSVEIPKGFFT